jgi:hypothetical protein
LGHSQIYSKPVISLVHSGPGLKQSRDFHGNPDGTTVRNDYTGEDLQKRGFPGAVLPDDPGGLAGANLKGDVAERYKILVVLFPKKGSLFSRYAGKR